MGKICLISHKGDPDGVFSQALLFKRLSKLKTSVIKRFLIEIYDLKKVLTCEGISEYDEIYLTDLCVSENYISEDELYNISRSSKLFVYDHHELNDSRKDLLNKICEKYCYNAESCTTKILTDLYFCKDEYSNYMSCIAQATDYNLINDYFWFGKKVEDIINFISSEKLSTLVEDICNKQCFANNMLLLKYEEILKEASNQEKISCNKIQENTDVFEVIGLNFAFGFLPSLYYGKKGLMYLALQNPTCDFGIAIYENRADVSISNFFKPNSAKINIVDFCTIKGGGGRNNAGGYMCDCKITHVNMKFMKKKIKHEIEQWLMESYC